MSNLNYSDAYKLKLFLTLFPVYRDKITNFIYIGDMETIFYMHDGGKVIFDELNKSAQYIDPHTYGQDGLPEEEWLNEFSRKIKRKLSMKNMNRKELASMVGVPLNTIYRYVKGERVPNIFIIKKIAQVLECDVRELVNFDYLLH